MPEMNISSHCACIYNVSNSYISFFTAPETLNSLPADPVTEVLEDTTLGHSNHIYDLSCKICTGKQDPSFVRQDLVGHSNLLTFYEVNCPYYSEFWFTRF